MDRVAPVGRTCFECDDSVTWETLGRCVGATPSCGSAGYCYRGPGDLRGYCTVTCDGDDDCPGDFSCRDLEVGANMCERDGIWVRHRGEPEDL